MDAIELLKKARAGDRQARDRMVEENVGLVWNIVKRFNGRGYDPEDLFQIGCIGLIKSIDHFNLDFEVRFSTYAVPMIMGEIKRFMRDDGMIKRSGWGRSLDGRRRLMRLRLQLSWHRRRLQWQSRQTGMWTLSIVRSISRRAKRSA